MKRIYKSNTYKNSNILSNGNTILIKLTNINNLIINFDINRTLIDKFNE